MGRPAGWMKQLTACPATSSPSAPSTASSSQQAGPSPPRFIEVLRRPRESALVFGRGFRPLGEHPQGNLAPWASVPRLLALAQPVAELLGGVGHLVARVRDALARLLEQRAEALGVVVDRVAGL